MRLSSGRSGIVCVMAAAGFLLPGTAFAQSALQRKSELANWLLANGVDLDPRLSLSPEPVPSPWLASDDERDGAGVVAMSDSDSFFDVSLGMLQEKPAAGAGAAAPAEGADSLAGKATNPIASLIQLQFQNIFVPSSVGASGVANSFLVQPVIPFTLGGQTLITRTTIPIITTPTLGPTPALDSTTALGDIVFLSAATFNIKDKFWGGMWGVGPTFTFPSATDDLTGAGKWQVGPTLVYINLANPKLQWGVLAYQQWSFAGQDDRKGVSKLYFQPVLTAHFQKGVYLALPDLLWTIDWNDNARWTIPVGFRLGKVAKFGDQPLNVFIEPFYNVGDPAKGTPLWGIKLSVSLLFPTSR